MKDIFKTALVLCLIAIVAGVLLGGVNQFTYMTDEEKLQRNLEKVYQLEGDEQFVKIPEETLKSFAPSDSTNLGKIDVAFYIPNKNVYVYQTDTKGFASGLKLMVCVKDNMVISIEKVAGGETLAKPFEYKNYSKYFDIDLTTINGFRTTDKKYNEDKSSINKHEIEAVTGATLSSNAIAYAIDTIVGYHKNLVAADYHNNPSSEGGDAK